VDAIKAMEQKLETFEEKIQAPVERKANRYRRPAMQSLKLGEKVLIASLKSEGIVTALSGRCGSSDWHTARQGEVE